MGSNTFVSGVIITVANTASKILFVVIMVSNNPNKAEASTPFA